ncbi:MAG: hypothetical protein FWH38_04600 [Treponema sp.]|nr:hypothetical protein [Treponema sp.]
MKDYCKLLGVIALAAVIGFSIAACGGDDGDNSPPPSLEGSWYNDIWSETFTFNVAAKTYTKMNDQGWGERGTFAYTSASFTYTVTEAYDGSSWGPPDPSKQLVWDKTYIFSGGKLILDGEWVYVKVD